MVPLTNSIRPGTETAKDGDFLTKFSDTCYLALPRIAEVATRPGRYVM
jgi:hypothetical protein